jgi:hypothetical protein
MIIMQTSDAAARRSHLETQGLARVIFGHEGDDFTCVQYHPKGIKGTVPIMKVLCDYHERLTLVS